ncbi:hypothetical protein OC835_007350 [Tilletia horrida]|nr:hypothetical protein OC835_007350 [Tilletia horrida]
MLGRLPLFFALIDHLFRFNPRLYDLIQYAAAKNRMRLSIEELFGAGICSAEFSTAGPCVYGLTPDGAATYIGQTGDRGAKARMGDYARGNGPNRKMRKLLAKIPFDSWTKRVLVSLPPEVPRLARLLMETIINISIRATAARNLNIFYLDGLRPPATLLGTFERVVAGLELSDEEDEVEEDTHEMDSDDELEMEAERAEEAAEEERYKLYLGEYEFFSEYISKN